MYEDDQGDMRVGSPICSPHSRIRPVVALVAHGIHDRGGMERACAELIRRSNDSLAFTVICADLDPRLRELVDRWIRVRIPRRPSPVRFAVFFLLAGWALRRVDAAIVHTVGAIVPNRVDLASIHFCHAGYREAVGLGRSPGASWPRRLNRAMAQWQARAAERWCYRPARLSALAAVSQGVAGEVSRHFPGVPVRETRNGVDATRFHPDAASRDEVRQETSTDPDAVVALFVGGDWRRKGLELAVEALAAAASVGTFLRLWVVGAGDVAQFQRIARRAGVAEQVLFFGPRSDTHRFYQAADIFVLPSAYETFSIASFEAAACGLPLVIPPLHGASELVGNDEGGMIVERTASSIGHAFARLAQDKTLREQLGGEAARRALQYSWDRSVDSVLEIYRALLAEAADGRSGRRERR